MLELVTKRTIAVALATATVLALASSGSASTAQSTCSFPAHVAFWTANDWGLLGQELQKQLSPCADYYISIPPLATDQTALRTEQDDVIRKLGEQFHPVAELRLAGERGWAEWVTGAPGRTWFDAGVEFRRRMAQAGYQVARGETWLLNEMDRSTARNEAPYPRAAMSDLLRGLRLGDGTQPSAPGIVEIGIAYSHQNIPDVEKYKTELKSWLADSAFWSAVAPSISMLAREAYGDARYWGVTGSSRNERARRLTQYMEHAINLVNAGPASISVARELWSRTYTAFGGATWPALGPDPYTPPFCCGHGWTMISLDGMLAFVSEQIYSIRRYVGNHRHGAPAGRLGFSWQPTNNYDLPPAEWDAAKRAIASRIGAAIRDSYKRGLVWSNAACRPPQGPTDFCLGADVPNAGFTNAWRTFERWS